MKKEICDKKFFEFLTKKVQRFLSSFIHENAS